MHSATTKGDFSIVKLDTRPSKGSQDNAHQQQSKDGPRINRDITAKEIRLIDAEGEMQGVVTVRAALDAAEAAGLDLVEISPHSEPPVCKILDYGKYKYEMHKKAVEAKKKQKVIELKEIKLRPTIDDNDFNVKMRSARAFLGEGDKVKITLRFRGREMSHQELGYQLIEIERNTPLPLGGAGGGYLFYTKSTLS
ncbi:MAG: translation initiation factor IF-3 [Alphaproteobacteria bacterium]|nr:translation initiation factor IF-3 [Alphaproteobacteria bacterium]